MSPTPTEALTSNQRRYSLARGGQNEPGLVMIIDDVEGLVVAHANERCLPQLEALIKRANGSSGETGRDGVCRDICQIACALPAGHDGPHKSKGRSIEWGVQIQKPEREASPTQAWAQMNVGALENKAPSREPLSAGLMECSAAETSALHPYAHPVGDFFRQLNDDAEVAADDMRVEQVKTGCAEESGVPMDKREHQL